jgi:hypothetical protein
MDHSVEFYTGSYFEGCGIFFIEHSIIDSISTVIKILIVSNERTPETVQYFL